MNSFPQGWYAILPLKEIRSRLVVIKRLGIDLIVWRDNKNQIIVMEDLCPHRSAKLSVGTFKDNKIICKFHAFEYDASGQCVHAPEFNKPIPKLCVKKFATKVEIGMVWMFYGLIENDLAIEPLQQIYDTFAGTYCYISKIWKSHITRCIENQLDYTHLPSVHHNTIGKKFTMPQNAKFIKSFDGIKSFHRDNNDGPSTEYVFPNSWILNISANFKMIVFFVPISEVETKFYIFNFRQFLNNFMTKKIFDFILNITNKIILRQDQMVVESQGLTPSNLSNNELLMKHDGAIKLFRELWNERM
ncbi:MAG: aromatic ring-hydroxylating dioxygenase subunit alpha [Burkholderiales bacterium]|nr:aromatic ring-hydroxylating dioxygenase subunit alpha [Burkholderiales bacterium]